MSFPAYPAYKDSGVEWLGVVPDHWAVTLLKRGYQVVLGKMLQPEARRDDDEFLPYLRAANIQLSGVDTVDVKRMWIGAEEKKSLLLRRGDLLVSEGGDVGRSAIWDFNEEECYFQNSINRIRSIDGNNTRFLYFWMIAIKKNGYVDVLCNKSTIAHFTAEKVAAVPLPIPTKSEQAQIARFLDHETARIDALIEEQQRLIELLKEKRQAVISHAVTKGLDPMVSMKDSGVEWLGEVPAHWDISNIKRVATIRYGIGEPPQYHPEGVPLIRATNVHAGKLFSQGLVFVDPAEIPARRIVWLESGDIVVVRSGAYTGDSAIIPHEYGSCIAGFDMVLRCHSAQPDFIQFALLSKYLKEGQLDLEKMRAAQPHLNAEELGACMLVLPGMEEQIRIVEFLQIRCTEFDILMTEAERAKSLLQERRSALISAAVTGKIDVRGWQPPASTQAPKFEVVEVV